MSTERFELALSHLRSAEWERFERLASHFLAAEFPNLRTTASPGGDEGRDAELFSPTALPTVVLQYSVTEEWRSKILTTAKRLSETRPDTRILIYATNHVVGAAGDDLKQKLLTNSGLTLDIRDRNWFLERRRASPAQESAADELIRAVADPFLAEQGIAPNQAVAIGSEEARAALVYLELQWQDDVRDKGLTKLAFEALVRSALRGTNLDRRLSRSDVLARVQLAVPSHEPTQVAMYANSALERLAKSRLRHWRGTDEFSLTPEESERISGRLAELRSLDNRLLVHVREVIKQELPGALVLAADVIDDLAVRTKRVLEKVLLSRGEAFADALRTGSFEKFEADAITDVVIRDFADLPDISVLKGQAVTMTGRVVRHLLRSPGAAIQSYLRSLADSYTIFSFLLSTPDVQRVVSKMFSHGEIWLDTSFVLPLLFEVLLDPTERRFSAMVAGANEAGIQIRVTNGILEEIERHINRSVACARTRPGAWRGPVPFLLSGYTLAGKSLATFPAWVELFRGEKRPEDDIAAYLAEIHSIQRGDLEKDVEAAPKALVHTVDSVWRHAHESRRSPTGEWDSMVVDRLIRHDVETFVGVIQRRSQERDSPFGYTSWLVTLDRSAFDIAKQLKQEIGYAFSASPIMSADFLATFLTVGPLRSRVARETESRIPLLVDTSVQDFMPPEFLNVAEQTRAAAQGLPERILRRRLRDKLDEARQTQGSLVAKGMDAVLETVRYGAG